MYRRLSQARLKACYLATKPPISKTHTDAKLSFAEDHVTWADDNWFKVHLRDATKFNLVGSDGQQYVERLTEARLFSKCVKISVKFEGGRVMV